MVPANVDSALARKLNTFVKLSPDELAVLAELQSKPFKVERGQDLMWEGQSSRKAFILQTGWGCSFKIMPNGGRQVIALAIAGDCIGLRSILLRTSDHSFCALTEGTVSAVESPRMLEVFRAFPRLSAAFLWAVSRDDAMVVAHLVSLGRRSALERAAHFFMELGERLSLAGLASATQFKCPVNQYVIADALGLSAIHVNRVFRQLREQGLLTVGSGEVTIHDPVKLRALAGYRSVDADREDQ